MKMTSIAAALLAVACGGSHGKMRTDTPALPYQEPDIAEITGIPEEDPSDEVAPDPLPSSPATTDSTATSEPVAKPAVAAPTGKASAAPKK